MDDINKLQRGGKRSGSGRKKIYGEPLVLVRVPESLKEKVLMMREFSKQHIEYDICPAGAMIPADMLMNISAPLFSSRIPAGFPSPADDYIENRLDLNEHFITSPSSTFFLRATGDSMNKAGIFEHTILQVDRSLEVRHNDIVVAAVDGEFTVKRYIRRNDGIIMLCPDSDNPLHQPIICYKDRDILIFGVVCAIHQKLR